MDVEGISHGLNCGTISEFSFFMMIFYCIGFFPIEWKSLLCRWKVWFLLLLIFLYVINLFAPMLVLSWLPHCLIIFRNCFTLSAEGITYLHSLLVTLKMTSKSVSCRNSKILEKMHILYGHHDICNRLLKMYNRYQCFFLQLL
jgi:hypothetical protein